MSNRIHCNCQRCRIRSLMGPTIVITVGILFLLQQMRGGYFDFSNTYPVILIVIGIISLGGALASSEGHQNYIAPVSPLPPSGSGLPPVGTPSNPYQGQGQ
jgi:hypothetical protein